MKVATIAALEPIGWREVIRHHPETAFKLLDALKPDISPKEAKADLDALEKLEAAAVKICNAAADLSSIARDTVDFWSAEPDERDRGDVRAIQDAINALAKLEPGIAMAREQLKPTADHHKPGRPRSEKPAKIAAALAEVLYFGAGEKPSAGRDGSTGQPNGSFQTALIAVLEAEGCVVPSATTINSLAMKARNSLTTERMEKAASDNLKTKRRVYSRHLSLFDFTKLQELQEDE